jgi:hypothetical protein
MPSRKLPKKQPFAVGTRVRLSFGGRDVVGTVVEDRGPVGMGGRWLLRVRIEIEGTSEPIELEMPAADLNAAA